MVTGIPRGGCKNTDCPGIWELSRWTSQPTNQRLSGVRAPLLSIASFFWVYIPLGFIRRHCHVAVPVRLCAISGSHTNTTHGDHTLHVSRYRAMEFLGMWSHIILSMIRSEMKSPLWSRSSQTHTHNIAPAGLSLFSTGATGMCRHAWLKRMFLGEMNVYTGWRWPSSLAQGVGVSSNHECEENSSSPLIRNISLWSSTWAPLGLKLTKYKCQAFLASRIGWSHFYNKSLINTDSIKLLLKEHEPGIVGHTWNPNHWKTQVRGPSWVPASPGYRDTPCCKRKQWK